MPAAPTAIVGTYDEDGRLVEFPGKLTVTCPAQTDRTAVILVAGQSNAANNGANRFTTEHPKRVLNYFNGRCFLASSPLLGSTGEGGEFITPLGDALIDAGHYDSVVIVSTAYGGSPIFRWMEQADLNRHLIEVVSEAQDTYTFTHFVWHQGETDFLYMTSEDNYSRSFRSLLNSLRAIEMNAPTFISVSTICGNSTTWQPDNPTARSQRSLVNNEDIFLGADTDALLTTADRQSDGCHMTATGHEKVALAYAAAIAEADSRQTITAASRPFLARTADPR